MSTEVTPSNGTPMVASKGEPVVQIHRKALQLLAVPVTLGVLAAVVGALASLYAWADSRSSQVTETQIQSVQKELVDHKTDIEGRVGRLENSQFRGEQKLDWVLMRGGLGMPPGVQSATDARAADVAAAAAKSLDGGP